MAILKTPLDPVLVDLPTAANLLSVPVDEIKKLTQSGELPRKFVGTRELIPYRSLLIFAGVGRWRYQEIAEP
jgi:hypothetical protein